MAGSVEEQRIGVGQCIDSTRNPLDSAKEHGILNIPAGYARSPEGRGAAHPAHQAKRIGNGSHDCMVPAGIPGHTRQG
ncbi:hypothetical protein NtRootA9_25190 [Arthrobacter sp. NtRootA9]|jgi:hypothetical protein|nr:hypothetical protein NtRootA9_25190 [Arthrobacter sp. NtRootA9]